MKKESYFKRTARWLFATPRRQFMTFIVGAVVLLFLWLVLPVLLNPFVRVPSSMLPVTIDCVPSTVTIETRTGYLEPVRARLLFMTSGSTEPFVQFSFQAVRQKHDDGATIILTLPVSEQEKAVNQRMVTSDMRLVLNFLKTPYFDIDQVILEKANVLNNRTCRELNLKGEMLKRRIEVSEVQVMHYSLVQDRISDWVKDYNQFLGNIALALLGMGAFWIGALVLTGLTQAHLFKDEKLKTAFEARFETASPDYQKQGRELVIQTDFVMLERRLAFARVVGPAVGFVLTVSSLIAGLHPSKHGSHDQFFFVSSLQIALVATFLGLLIRLLAEFAIRYHRAAADRKLALLGNKT